jgi:prepilin-type N-terminal cleavage/methylation domain-containing protein
VKKGFTLIEVIIGIAIFLLIAISVWEGFTKILQGVTILKVKNTATAIVNEQFEIIRNMPYEDVGIVDGIPDGIIPEEISINRNNRNFKLSTTVRNIDQSFDGEVGQSPSDSNSADNKLVEILIECIGCSEMQSFTATSLVAPKNSESTTNTGALYVNVIDANGNPVSNANVRIENNKLTNPILVTEQTDINGIFKLIGAPPGNEAYEIAISKTGYSSEETYTSGLISNPVPDKPHSTVLASMVTSITFAIDKLSQINFDSMNTDCSPLSGINFNFYGEKTIGQNVLKNSSNLVTNSNGELSLNNIEWDLYNLDITDTEYFLAGSNPMIPFYVSPDSIKNISLIMEPKRSKALLVHVIDSSSKLPIADAKVELSLNSFESTKYTGTGAMIQTDWSGGSGQNLFGDLSKYFSQNGNLEIYNPSGELRLAKIGNDYYSSGELVSSTFDVGTTTNFHFLNFEPEAQLQSLGPNPVKLQVATNEFLTATTTWDYIGPDGGSSSYFTSSGESFHNSSDGDRYLRYKLFFNTDDVSNTPTLSDVSFTYSSGCSPSGQVYFDSLDTGTYTINVSKNGYTTFNSGFISVFDDWQNIEINLHSI